MVRLDDAAQARRERHGAVGPDGREPRRGQRAAEPTERAAVRGDRRRRQHQGRQRRRFSGLGSRFRVVFVVHLVRLLDAVAESVQRTLRRGEGQGEYHVALVERSGAYPADAHSPHAHELRPVGEVDAVLTQPDGQRGDLMRAALALAHGAQVAERLRGKRVRVRRLRRAAAFLLAGGRRAVHDLGGARHARRLARGAGAHTERERRPQPRRV
mmetsp:Transcript_12141/g.48765  ORF Transcript_12141/g.48765 Transcript_12141/m.48765 type:complete len:213 (+) Transcript_12141:4145-4783(+)